MSIQVLDFAWMCIFSSLGHILRTGMAILCLTFWGMTEFFLSGCPTIHSLSFSLFFLSFFFFLQHWVFIAMWGLLYSQHEFSCLIAWGILVSWPGIKPVSPALEGRWILNHWTTRKTSPLYMAFSPAVYKGSIFHTSSPTLAFFFPSKRL